MAYDERLATRVRSFFKQHKVAFEEKHMMGGLCFMVEGKMCVGVEKSRLMARLDPAVYASALKRSGCVPMDFTGRPMRGFVFVNPVGLAEDTELETWLNLALEFNPKAKASRTKFATATAGEVRAKAEKIPRRASRTQVIDKPTDKS